ncbi:MAG: hypothetical protein BroJett029_05420 [Alphaproteobacteria bacterium]|nr:MAG: hypothetical protein BroJett029_05420 [Alphaproteobacteria bacterium]
MSWGVGYGFAERSYVRTPDAEIWISTAEELLAPGFVKEIAEGQFVITKFGIHATKEEISR